LFFKQNAKHELLSLLEKIYNLTLNGFFIFKSSKKLAKKYNIYTIDRLIIIESLKAGIWGFITGFGGIFILPFTLTLNIIAVLFIQVRLISAIAIIANYKLDNEKIKIIIIGCLTGNSFKELLKEFNIKESKILIKDIIKKLTDISATKITSKIEYTLVRKTTQKAAVNITKAIPFIAGIVGFIIESFATYSIGYTAKSIFILNTLEEKEKKTKSIFKLIIILIINALIIITSIIGYFLYKRL